MKNTLLEAKEASGKSYQKIAEDMGLSFHSRHLVFDIIKNDYAASLEMIGKICAVLGIPEKADAIYLERARYNKETKAERYNKLKERREKQALANLQQALESLQQALESLQQALESPTALASLQQALDKPFPDATSLQQALASLQQVLASPTALTILQQTLASNL